MYTSNAYLEVLTKDCNYYTYTSRIKEMKTDNEIARFYTEKDTLILETPISNIESIWTTIDYFDSYLE
jgi:hypothetical protein